jgi:hypothetical protein
MVSTLAAQSADGTAKVIRLKGDARYTIGNNVWEPLTVGTELRAGTVIQTSTESGSFVDLVLGDTGASTPRSATFQPYIPNSMDSSSLTYAPSSGQNIIRVWQNSVLGIDKVSSVQTGADQVTDTQLDLKAGRITGSVKKMSAASKYEVKLPTGVAGIRGTVYDITADGSIRVLVGSVVVATVDAKSGNVVTQVVMGGQQYDARTGQVNPIPPSDVSAFERINSSMRYVQAVQPTTLAPNRTVINVSPIGGGIPPE